MNSLSTQKVVAIKQSKLSLPAGFCGFLFYAGLRIFNNEFLYRSARCFINNEKNVTRYREINIINSEDNKCQVACKT